MAPLPLHPGLLPPPFIPPPTLAKILDHFYIDPAHTPHRDPIPNPAIPTCATTINANVPALTIYPSGYGTLSLHSDQQIHHIQTNQANPIFHHIKNIHHTQHTNPDNQAINPNHTHHARPFHHKHNQDNQNDSSHFPLNLLLLPLFIFLLLTTIYHLFSWTHGHDKYTFSPPNPSEPREYDYRRARAKSVSCSSSSSSSDTRGGDEESGSNEKKGGNGGKGKVSKAEINERTRLLDRYNGANTYIFEDEEEMWGFCRGLGYGGCSVRSVKPERELKKGGGDWVEEINVVLLPRSTG